MAAKTLARTKGRKSVRTMSYGLKLQVLLEEQRSLTNRLARLIEDMEDEEDHRAIERAKKRDAGKPGIPWEEARKRLGLRFD